MGYFPSTNCQMSLQSQSFLFTGVFMKIDFASKTLEALTIPNQKFKSSFTDIRTRGLQFELRPSGGFFSYRYTHQQRQRSIPIGRYGVISVADARNQALSLARMVALGQDPMQIKEEQRGCLSLHDFYVIRYLPFAKANKRSWKSDASLYNNHIQDVFGQVKLNQISNLDVQHFLYKKVADGSAKGTANRMLSLIRHMFNLALNWKITGVKENPAKGIKSFEENNKIERYVSPEEASALKQALENSENPSLKFIIAFLLVTGARKNEALKARWQDVDFNANVWRIPVSKSGRVRHVPLSSTALQFLRLIQIHNAEVLGPQAVSCPFIFPNPNTQKPFSSVFYAWDTARKKAGLADVRIHDLRHTFASTLVNQGVPLYEVQKLLGHSQIRTTERYAHLQQKRLQESAGFAGKVFEHILITPMPEVQIL